MAEASKIKSRKWVVALAVLVALAIIGVIIALCIPKNVDKLKNKVNAQEVTMFLQNNDEISKYQSFLDKINKDAPEHYTNAKDTQRVTAMLKDVLHFYNQYLPFAKSNKTFQSQYNAINGALKKADSYQKEMDNLLQAVYTTVENSSAYTSGAWLQFEGIYQNYIASFASAFDGLSIVFHDCTPRGLTNTDFTYKVLQTTNDYFKALSKNKKLNTYQVNYAETFIKQYINSAQSTIFTYEFSQELQDKLEKINTFTQVYKGDTIKDVIESITISGITYQKPDIEDENGVLDILKTYLEGGLR